MTISIGRFNIPGILLAYLFSFFTLFILSLFFIRDKKDRNKSLEIFSNALIIGFFIWKLSPIFRSFSLENPLAFIFLPGSRTGTIFSILLSAVYLCYKYIKIRFKPQFILSIVFVLLTIGINTTLSNLESKSLNKESITLISNLGLTIDNKPTIINFWASWCAPCISEIPELNDFYINHKDEINFYGVNMSSTEKGNIDNFIKSNNMKFPIIYDSTSNISAYFNIKSIPTTIIITNSGENYYLEKFSGAVTKEILESAIN